MTWVSVHVCVCVQLESVSKRERQLRQDLASAQQALVRSQAAAAAYHQQVPSSYPHLGLPAAFALPLRRC